MRRRRRVRRAKLVIAAIVAIVLVPWLANSSLEEYRDYRLRKELSARRQRSLDYTAPPDQVVYAEDRVTAERLVASDPNYVRIGDGVCYVQPALRELPNAHLGNGPPIVFLHGRRSPSGTICLVGVGLLALPGAAELRADLVFRVTKDDWVFSKASRPDLTFPRVNEQRITFFTGQPDPTEESHFTIGYRINYQSGIIDGWLRGDRSVKLQVRHDPAKTPHK